MLKIKLEIKNSDGETGAGMVFVCNTTGEGDAACNAVNTIVAAAVAQIGKTERATKEV